MLLSRCSDGACSLHVPCITRDEWMACFSDGQGGQISYRFPGVLEGTLSGVTGAPTISVLHVYHVP